jgi:ribosomal protein S18 acetylase RimI-like enzyme
LLVRGEPAGRLILNLQDAETGRGLALHIVDLQVGPSHRGRGLGRWALEQVLARATPAGQRVDLRVAPDNPARRLYERLGFHHAHELRENEADAADTLSLVMQWTPP